MLLILVEKFLPRLEVYKTRLEMTEIELEDDSLILQFLILSNGFDALRKPLEGLMRPWLSPTKQLFR